MILTCIGTGTAVPEPDRVCSGFLLEGHGLRMLFDCGPGVVHAMARLGSDWQNITHLCLTHFHNDHIGDVPMLFFAWKHGMRPARSEPLTIFGPKGTKRKLVRMAKLFGDHISEPPFELRIHELDSGAEVRLNDVAEIRSQRTRHTDRSLAFRLEVSGRSFCYTGDTGYSDDVAKFAQAADVLLTECSLPDALAMDVHLTPSQVAAMARVALPRRLLVTHVYPQLDRAEVPLLVREGGWPAEVHVVRDGEKIEI
jgi:ribonuclease BN (tRNA processing enzyme)